MVREATAVVLAGGMSRRFGQDKAHAPLGGEPLLHWVIRAAACVSARVVIAARPGQVLPDIAQFSKVHVVADARVDAGPIAGLEAAFREVSAASAFVVSCDAPLLVPGLARALVERLGDADVVMPVVGGRRQPLVAAYRVETCLAAFTMALDEGERRLLTVLDGLAIEEMHAAEVARHDPRLESFANLNTPGALAALESRLRGNAVETPGGPAG